MQILQLGLPYTLRAVLPLVLFWGAGAHAKDLAASTAMCNQHVGAFNQQFNTISTLDGQGNIPEDSGLIVHTIHGPGPGATDLNMTHLNGLTPQPNKTCGALMTDPKAPIFLPWCGSNRNVATGDLSDASSWTYIRDDTLINASAQQPVNEVVCEANAQQTKHNKRYGLIFNNAYMNEGDNLGCMYPLDGDTGNRKGRGCGVSQNQNFSQYTLTHEAKGACPTNEDATVYLTAFDQLLNYTYQGQSKASIAGSLTCALPKSKFDVWVDVRKKIDLGFTTWPVNEFVLWNWETYSSAALAKNNYITGIYYLSGCKDGVAPGNRTDAQAIADLYESWTGVSVPVVNLSNSDLHAKSKTPFSCQ